MDELENLFIKREKEYEANTTEILLNIKTVTKAAKTFLEIYINKDYITGDIQWKQVYLVDGYLLVFGIWRFDLGTTTIVDGEMLTITKELAEDFRRNIRVSLPAKMASSSHDDVVNFLRMINEESDGEENESFSDTDTTEFNVDNLTDDQKASLLLHTLKIDKGGSC